MEPSGNYNSERVVMVVIIAVVVIFLSVVLSFTIRERQPFIIGVPGENSTSFSAVREFTSTRGSDGRVPREDPSPTVVAEKRLPEG